MKEGEGGRRSEGGLRRREEGGGKEEGGRREEEGGRREEGGGRREEGGGRREEGGGLTRMLEESINQLVSRYSSSRPSFELAHSADSLQQGLIT